MGLSGAPLHRYWQSSHALSSPGGAKPVDLQCFCLHCHGIASLSIDANEIYQKRKVKSV